MRVLWVGIEPTDYVEDEISALEQSEGLEIMRLFLTAELTQPWTTRSNYHLISSEAGRLPSLLEVLINGRGALSRSFDVAVMEGYSPWQMTALIAMTAARKIPYILRSDTPLPRKTRSLLKTQILRAVVRGAAWCLPGGTPQMDNLLKVGADPATCRIGFMGVDTAKFRPVSRSEKRDNVKLLGVGRLLERKGWLIVAQIVAQLRAEKHRIEFEVVGDGPLRRELERIAEKEPAIIVRGVLTQRDVIAAYQNSDVFVFPARDENWGLVVNEAMACGLPVIVGKDVGCAKDLVTHGSNGFLVDPDDACAIRDAILAFVRRPQLLQSMSLRAAETAQQWSSEKRREATVEALRNATRAERT